MPETLTQPSARFAGRWFDSQRQALIGLSEGEVSLRPQSLQVFRHLAEHADHAVRKE